MQGADSLLPCPVLTVEVTVPPPDPPGRDAAVLELAALPAGPGVFALEDDRGRCICLAISADVRRLVRSRLIGGDAAAVGAGPRPDYRAVTRRVRAVPVGSAFEAEWAWLQLARRLAPATYRAIVDRWQAWFIQIDPEADFPQLVKTAHPGRQQGGPTSRCLGPMPDKHAAQRYLEVLQDAFDLCRYHHILVQAPRGAACAYKEMGRCPAPCDGSIGMEEYRAAVRRAVEFAATAIKSWRESIESRLATANDAGQADESRRLRRWLEATRPATRPAFAAVDDLERFHWLAVMPSESPAHVRLFLIDGGRIAPLADVSRATPWAEVRELLDQADRGNPWRDRVPAGDDADENIGLVCRQVFMKRGKGGSGAFLSRRDALTGRGWAAAMRRAVPRGEAPIVAEQQIESDQLIVG